MASFVVTSYSNAWPNLFHDVKVELVRLFASTSITVEHIGSTSVPGLSAKPVIDVLVGAMSLADIESKISLLGEHGYLYVSKYENEIPERRYFVKSPADSLRFHIHAVELGSRIWHEHLAFRNALRNDSSLRAKYQSLKLQLAEQFANDKPAYSAAKNPFIESVLAAISDRGSLV